MFLFYSKNLNLQGGIKMKHAVDASSVCRSVFHGGEATTKEHYTQVWVRLINQLERNRSVPASVH